MKKVLGLGFIALALSACAPAAGRQALLLQGTTQDMVTTAAAACPTVAPSGYNYLSVGTIGDTSVTCSASATTGEAILEAFAGDGDGPADLTVTISFSQVGDSTVQVAISTTPNNDDVANQLQNVLLQKFPAATTPAATAPEATAAPTSSAPAAP